MNRPATPAGKPAGPLSRLFAYTDPFHARLAQAGFTAKRACIGEVELSYAEGPANGPPLLLLHAQLLDWFSYSRVMPLLASSFHLYVLDYPGHGTSTTPGHYPMTAPRIGADLAAFCADKIGRPAYISGNSSGGLLALWLAASHPALVRALLLEDPPLFSAEYPRIKQTIADRAFRTSHLAATRDQPDDFLLYWIAGNAPFFRRHIGPGTPFLLTQLVRAYRRANPGRPVEIGLIPNPTIRMMLRGLDQYDPRFGAAFYDGSWHGDFSHEAALRTVSCPVLLLQARSEIMADGTLNGAMSADDAARAMSLLRNGRFVKTAATHVVNLARPAFFAATAKAFLSAP